MREADPLAPDEMTGVFLCEPLVRGADASIDWQPLMARIAR